MSGPRVAHVISTPAGIGGAESLLVQLVALGEAHDLEQVVLNPYATQPTSNLSESFPNYRCLVRPGLRGVMAQRRWIKAELARFRPDVIHVLLFHALVTVASIRRPRGGPPRLVTHVYGEGLRHRPRSAGMQLLDRWAVGRCDHVVAISEAVRCFLLSEYHLPAAKVECIPPGWVGEPLPRSGAARDPTVICVAKLRPEKGHSLLLKALPLVRRAVPDVRLMLIGDGECLPALVTQAAEAGVSDNVSFAGAVTDIWPYLARADVFVLASVTEAFGIAIVEAMAAGLPVVAPAVGGIPELVTPGVTGHLFPPGDHQTMARLLVSVLSSPDTRRSMGDAARKVAQPLRTTNTLRRYLEVYDELLRGHPTACGGQVLD